MPIFRSLASFLVCAGAVCAADWPALRGPHFDQSTEPAPVLEQESIQLTLRWRRALGSGYAAPIVSAGAIITAFQGGANDVLAAFALGDGGELWRTTIAPTHLGRDGANDGPTGSPSADGTAVFAAYVERARAGALEVSGVTWPTVAGDTIVVRNLSQLAAVAITAGDAATVTERAAEPAAAAPPGAFERELHATLDAFDPGFALDRLLAGTRLPVIERGARNALGTFVYRGKAEDVGMSATFMDDGEERPLRRLGQTDVYYRTEQLVTPGLYEYWLNIDYDHHQPDPANPVRSAPGGFWMPSDVSVLDLDSGLPPERPLYQGTGRGRVERFDLGAGDDQRRALVYLPALPAGMKAPLLLTLGDSWFNRRGALPNLLDHLHAGGRVAPLAAATLPINFSDGRDERLARLFDLVLPELERRYPPSTPPASRCSAPSTAACWARAW